MKHDALLRLFVAIEVPDPVTRHLEAVQAALKASGAPVKWVHAHGIHLTLKFLGDVAAHRVDELTRALTKAAGGMEPFRLRPAHLGAFPSLAHPSVIWLSLAGDIDPLRALQRSVEKALKKRGFSPDRRGFHPHLTLGRVRRNAGQVAPLVSALRTYAPPDCSPWEVASFALVRSELLPTGARYTPLAHIELDTP